MGIVRFVLWSSICIGLGIFSATFELNGHTPLDHVTRLWKQQSPHLDKVKDGASDVMDEVKHKIATSGPTEHHSEDDRDAVNRIIAKRTQK